MLFQYSVEKLFAVQNVMLTKYLSNQYLVLYIQNSAISFQNANWYDTAAIFASFNRKESF